MSIVMLPEDKLLQLIRNDEPSQKRGLLSRSFFKEHLFLRRLAGSLSRLDILKGAWILLIAALCLFFISLFSNPYRGRIFTIRSSSGALSLPDERVLSKDKPLDYYISALSRESLFGQDETRKNPSSFTAVSDIALIGIIREEPLQAIVKDKKSNSTYFLKEGDTLGEITLIEILEDKIIIEYRKERFEVYL